MLYSQPRLGSLNTDLFSGSFRKSAITLTTAAAMAFGASALGTSSASAQQASLPFTQKQCSDAISIANSVVQRHKGRISNELIDSFVQFGKSHCDLKTKFIRLDGTDDERAFGEFRTLLIALRTADNRKPETLAAR